MPRVAGWKFFGFLAIRCSPLLNLACPRMILSGVIPACPESSLWVLSFSRHSRMVLSGIHFALAFIKPMDSRFRGNDVKRESSSFISSSIIHRFSLLQSLIERLLDRVHGRRQLDRLVGETA